ncbi:cytochrome P450 [Gordonia humi]|uniref:Cytochrome P450 n=1 Tax=Gordonia humi TaxID=686429 RepID=A0A840F3S7_9ACTN|nr:cytochrome P450 [Gordonia humi]MBB4134237.1 cytochrome P450 [Gordonia humi]
MTESPVQILEGEERNGCPVVHFDFNQPLPLNQYHSELDRLRAISPIVWNTYGQGFWMLLSDDTVREAYHKYEIFSSEATIPTVPEPDWHWIPTMENPPQHKLYRRVLNAPFSPRAIRDREDRIRDHAISFIEPIVQTGRVNFVDAFAKEFPTKVFLEIVGLPHEDSKQFVEWVEIVFGGLGAEEDGAADAMAGAQAAIRQYFADLLEDRKANPREDDFFTDLSQATIGANRITDEEFLNICNVLILAGLDTVKSQLGYCLLHLATHPDDRQRILDDPALIPVAVEELVRVYSIVMDGRKIVQDAEFHGCPMKAGEMAMLTVPSATRDETKYADPTQVDFDRTDATGHLAFAAGPHKCLGTHLARRELNIAMEEWHKRIPHYRAVDLSKLSETGPQLGLEELWLEWDVAE